MTAQTLLAEVESLQRKLRMLDADGVPSDGTETFIHRDGVYLSGLPYLWSSDANRAFCFRDREQAAEIIETFPLVLQGALVGQFRREEVA